jgi:ribonuclease J
MLKVTPLGGLGEVGLNTMLVEHGDDRVLVDCGVLFPRADQLGVDVVVPDFSVLDDAPDAFKAVVLTHAHEDHLGALPWLIRSFPVPIYGTPFTLALARHRLEEAGLKAELRPMGPGEAFSIGTSFRIEPVNVTHSVPDAVGLIIRTPSATMVHSGDFKLDLSPIDGKLTDLARLGQLGDEGVDLLMSDSTNSEVPGWTPSESTVKETFARLFATATHRIVVAQFGSQLHRVQHLLRLAVTLNRKVVLAGRSLQRNVELARGVGRLEVPDGLLVSYEEGGALPRNQLLVISTGAQAEVRSGLSNMVSDSPGSLRLEPDDLVVISARAIPGNEQALSGLLKTLYLRGIRVAYPGNEPGVHTSGHAAQDEQKRLLETVRPRSFVPIHGELRHLHRHRDTAVNHALVDPAQARVARNGDVLGVSEGGVTHLGRAKVGQLPMRRDALAPVSEAALQERRWLAEGGLVMVVVVLKLGGGRVLHEPTAYGQGLATEEHSVLPLAADGAALELRQLSEAIRGDDERVREAVLRGARRVFKQLLGAKPLVQAVVLRV